MIDEAKIFKQIEGQKDMLLRMRAVFPYIPKDSIGETSFLTAPYYQNYGLNLVFEFSKPLTDNDIAEFDRIGRWINQNFLVRLCTILEYNEVIPKEGRGNINFELEGAEHIEILRLLRNKFVHSSGRYNASKYKNRKLLKKIIRVYHLEGIDETAENYPVPINTLIIPMVEGCKRYIQALSEYEGRT